MSTSTAYLFLATIVQTVLLIWGLRTVSKILSTQASDNGTTFGMQMLTEKVGDPQDGGDAGDKGPGSFSRIAGTIGAIVLAAFFAGVSYWALHALFSDGDLNKLKDLGTFFLVGSALFAPYAFNQIRSIFQ